jgi:hypothetical protein
MTAATYAAEGFEARTAQLASVDHAHDARQRQQTTAAILANLLTFPAPVCVWEIRSVYTANPLNGMLTSCSTLDEIRIALHQWAAILDDVVWSMPEHQNGTHRPTITGNYRGQAIEIWDLCTIPKGVTVDDLSASPWLDAVDPLTGTGIASRQCEMDACTNRGARARSASGIYYVCDPCWEVVEQMTAQHLAEQTEQDAYDQAIAAEEDAAECEPLTAISTGEGTAEQRDIYADAEYAAEKADDHDPMERAR